MRGDLPTGDGGAVSVGGFKRQAFNGAPAEAIAMLIAEFMSAKVISLTLMTAMMNGLMRLSSALLASTVMVWEAASSKSSLPLFATVTRPLLRRALFCAGATLSSFPRMPKRLC